MLSAVFLLGFSSLPFQNCYQSQLEMIHLDTAELSIADPGQVELNGNVESSASGSAGLCRDTFCRGPVI